MEVRRRVGRFPTNRPVRGCSRGNIPHRAMMERAVQNGRLYTYSLLPITYYLHYLPQAQHRCAVPPLHKGAGCAYHGTS